MAVLYLWFSKKNKMSWLKDRWSDWAFLLGLILVFALRWATQPSFELNPDTSAWISGAISAAQSDTPLWTLLTHSDSRPLVVLPLYVLETIGISVTWFVADLMGVLLWWVSMGLFYSILRRRLGGWWALFYTAPLLIFQAAVLDADLVAYNAEHICVLMILGPVWWYLKPRTSRDPSWHYLLVGFWLGLFPFAKMQIVPMGGMIALFFLFETLRNKSYASSLFLVTGGVLPTALVNLYYTRYDGLATFWNDYFWNYYYYSFTQTYADIPVQERFGVGFIVQFFGQTANTRAFWLGVALLLLLAFVAWIRYRTVPPRSHMLAFSLFWLSFYATVQAGNLYSHYLLLLVIPALLLVVLGLTTYLPRLAPSLWGAFLLALVLQSFYNGWHHPNWEVMKTNPLQEQVVRDQIAHSVEKGQKMTIWGYADRFFVWQHVAAGNRLSHTFWAYWPSPLLEYRQRQCIQDMEHNQTDWFLDFTESGMPLNEAAFKHDTFPLIADYIRSQYQYVTTVGGVHFYKRQVK
jgi:hypothetical protein